MRTMLITVLVLAVAGTAFGAAGDIIRSFTVTGQPSYGIRGVAKDWSDGNLWVAGPNNTNAIIFAKINITTGSVIQSWQTMQNQYWVFDIGYGYIYGGNRVIIAGDQSAPVWRMKDPTNGSHINNFPTQPSVTYPEGIGCDWGGTICFATDYYSTNIYRWNGSSWATWATNPGSPCMGNDTGWGRLFVVTTSADYKIYEYTGIYNTSGSLTRSFALANWSAYMVGLGIGRVDATGNEESVFLATFYPSYVLYEISVGDITGTSIQPTSIGKIKALYK